MIFLVLLLIFGFAVLAFGAEEGHLGITTTQIKNLVWWTVNFIVLLMILQKFLRKPLRNFLRARSEGIQREYEELLQKKRQAEAEYVEAQEKLKFMEEEAKRIFHNYLEQGQKEKERIIREAEVQAQRLLEQTDLYIKQELERAKGQLRSELAKEVIKLAEEKLLRELTVEDHRKIFENLISNLQRTTLH